jgi:hypothetical protein
MVEPMEEDMGQAHPWDALPIQNPRQCIDLSGRKDHYVVSGEIVMFHDVVAITTLISETQVVLHSPVGRILRIEHSATNQPPRALVNLFVFPVDLPFFPLGDPVPPPNRAYLEYPTEVAWSNYVQWLPQDQLVKEAFVFLEEDIKNGSAGFCIGMENAFLVRCFWNHRSDGNVWTRLFRPAQFQTFPSDDCYSKRAWERLLKLARLIYNELSRSSITQRTSRSDFLDFNSGDWEYLRYRLEADAGVEVVSKRGVTSVPYSRMNGTIKEVIKCRLTKYMIRLDTMPLFESLQRVLGNSIMVGLRMPTPAAPVMRAQEKTAFSTRRGSTNNSFNLFFELPLVSLDGTTHRPIHRGIDFSYDSVKQKLRVSVRFRRAYPGDPSIMDHLDLDPPPEDSSVDSSETDNEDEPFSIEPGLTIGSSQVVLRVIRVTAGGSHAICRVVESTSHEYIHGSEKVLTMARARQLYHEYINAS